MTKHRFPATVTVREPSYIEAVGDNGTLIQISKHNEDWEAVAHWSNLHDVRQVAKSWRAAMHKVEFEPVATNLAKWGVVHFHERPGVPEPERGLVSRRMDKTGERFRDRPYRDCEPIRIYKSRKAADAYIERSNQRED